MDDKLIQQAIAAHKEYTKVCIEVRDKIRDLETKQRRYSHEFSKAQESVEHSLRDESVFKVGFEFCVPGANYMIRLVEVDVHLSFDCYSSIMIGEVHYQFARCRLTSKTLPIDYLTINEDQVKMKLETKEWIPATEENLKEAKRDNAVPKNINIKEFKKIKETDVGNSDKDVLYLIKADLKREKWYLVTVRQWRNDPFESRNEISHRIHTSRFNHVEWEYKKYGIYTRVGTVLSIVPSTRDGFALEILEQTL